MFAILFLSLRRIIYYYLRGGLTYNKNMNICVNPHDIRRLLYRLSMAQKENIILSINSIKHGY